MNHIKQTIKVLLSLIITILLSINPLIVLANTSDEVVNAEELDIEINEEEQSEKEKTEEESSQEKEDSDLNEEEQSIEDSDEQNDNGSDQDEDKAPDQGKEDIDTNEKDTNSDNDDAEEIVTEKSKKKTMETSSTSSIPFGQGARGDHVVELKLNLKKLGFGNYPAKPSNLFGDSTTNNVKKFQQYFDLEITGIADKETLSVLDKNVNSSYQIGKRGDHVVELKRNLTTLGIGNYPTNPSNTYGDSTERNVKVFQRTHGLIENGIVDDVTLAKMEDMLVLRQGARGQHVVELKINLTRIGIGNYPINPSDFYGDSTTNNVRKFQSYYNLKEVTGVADKETLDKIQEILNSDYQIGQRGAHVVTLKKNLTKLGIGNYPANPSNSYGSSTDRNVRKFQNYYGLNENGIADEVTLNKIQEILNSPYKTGESGSHVVELKKNLTRLGIGNYPENPSNSYGSSTERNVRAFQRYYGINENGIADEVTLNKIQEILNSQYRDGQRGDHVVQLKKNLTRLGFGNYPTNPSNSYGGSTERNVREFQRYFSLNENGIADEVTLNKIQEILKSPYQRGKSGSHVVELKKSLRKLGFGNYPAKPSNVYGTSTENNIKKFQTFYDLKISGIADEVTLSKIDDLIKTTRYISYNLSLSEAVNIQMRATPQTDQKYAYVSAGYINGNNTVTASALNVRSAPKSSGRIVGVLENGDRVNIISEVNGWYQIEFSGAGWVDAARKDVQYYLDPTNFINNELQRFQFLDLARPSGATTGLLNNYLKGKGILEGKGREFLEASITHGVNEVYLLSHALLETGNGTSQLATGVEVGKNKSGNLVLVNANNRSQLTNIKKTYNMYGIGAFDGNALKQGAFRAYNEGWFSPEAAIIGGAGFIGANYVKAGQNTIYKMRWNPDAMNNSGTFSHQYATDIGWAYKQVRNIYNLYQEINITTIYLEIPRYSK